MTTASSTSPSGGIAGALRRAEAWLDDRGKGAWIAAMVLGFVVLWPVGLALLAYMIWSKRMFSHSCGHRRHRHERGYDQSREAFREFMGRQGFRSSGNAAFDAYKADTLRRLQDEQEAFESFLNRLRQAKDKTEFDAFMEDRARSNAARDAERPDDHPTERRDDPPPSPAAGY
jgi:Protein of unknown function (DUF2852)